MSLLTNLISYWKLDEASGNALDAHGSSPLTDTNSVGSATGKIGNARDFEDGSLQYFEAADSAALSTGDIDFTFSGWCNLESVNAGNLLNSLLTKWNTSGNQREYLIRTNGPNNNRFEFFVSANGSSAVSVTAPITITTGVWYFFVAWHNSVANTINLQVNNGTVGTTSHSGGVFDSTAVFRLGAEGSGTVSTWDGLIDEVGFWKRTLTAAERARLYNSGSGLPYASFGATPGYSRARQVNQGVC